MRKTIINPLWLEFQVWKNDAPWHLRLFYGVIRKIFGKDFTPVKIQMRLPSLVWGGIAMEAVLGRKGFSRCVTFNWEKSALPRGAVVLCE